MPQAEAELREKWGGETGVDDGKAIAFLEARGWKQTATGMWRAPETVISDDEYDALKFLVQEWDRDFHPI